MTEAAGLCDLELEGVREAGVFGEPLPPGLRAPGGVPRPLEQEVRRMVGVSLPAC